jgi:hypothetical protein
LEDFDYDHQCSLGREVITRPGILDFGTAWENVVFGEPASGLVDPAGVEQGEVQHEARVAQQSGTAIHVP